MADKNTITSSQLQNSKNLLQHSELITVLMIAMRPKISQQCTKFKKENLKMYIREIREKYEEALNKKEIFGEREEEI